ncbi:MAG: hypothetical protein JXR78_05615 [Victivallales bacterium]|nr:hypothetical protein [Victivallales bacterium]
MVPKVIGALLLLFITHCMNAASLELPSPGDAYISPDTETVLKFDAKGSSKGSSVQYLIRNYEGKEIAATKFLLSDDGKLGIKVKLPAGYYEIAFPQFKQTFGVMSVPVFKDKPDLFFGVDAAYSWFPRGAAEKSLMEALKRNGVAIVRERLSWKEIGEDSNPSTWISGQGNRYLSVRKREAENGLKVLDVFHDAPVSTGADMEQRNPSRYPQELIVLNSEWLVLFKHLSPCISGMEAWNEPDDRSGPSSDYAPLVKALAWARHEAGVDTPIVGGVFSELTSALFRDVTGKNRMLDVVDAVSYHTYSDPMAVERTIAGYRSFLRKYKQASMPIYITESGWPWKSSNSRPDKQGGCNSARNICMKAVEAKACGVAQYYPFIVQYFKQDESNFSMMDQNNTPLRSLACYIQAIKALSNMDYIGDLKCSDAKIKRARVFSNGATTVAVLYTQSIKSNDSVKLPVKADFIQGIDGRVLAADSNGSIPIPDDMTYVFFNAKENWKYVQKNTKAMKLWTISRQKLAPRKITPIVIQPMLRTDQLECRKKRSSGYFVKNTALKKFWIPIKINNLSDKPQNATIKIVLPADVKLVDGQSKDTVTFPAKSVSDMEWQIDLSKCLSKRTDCLVSVEISRDGELLDFISLPLYNASMATNSYYAKRAVAPVIFTGSLDKNGWKEANSITLVSKDVDESNPAAMVVKAYFLWDESGLNFRFEVRDQIHIQNESPDLCWRQDSIQIAIDPMYSRQSDGSQYEYGMSLKDSKSRWFTWVNGKKKSAMSPSSRLEIKRHNDEKITVYEGNLSWLDIYPFKAATGKHIGLTFCVNNCDGGQDRTWLEWTEGIASGGKDPGLFAKVILSE